MSLDERTRKSATSENGGTDNAIRFNVLVDDGQVGHRPDGGESTTTEPEEYRDVTK